MERQMTFAGSWYSGDQERLIAEFDDWIGASQHAPTLLKCKRPNALILPHAGFRYCGATMAHGYGLLTADKDPPEHVILLHPSHKASFNGVRQCPFQSIITPFGKLKVKEIPGIQQNDPVIDEAEHSGEMHFPWLKCANVRYVTPVMVSGKWRSDDLLILRDFLHVHPRTVVIVSSDFCHFGFRFGYLPERVLEVAPNCSDAIKELDMEGFTAIKSNDPIEFQKYLNATKNTICGRQPILLAMELLRQGDAQWHILHYSQSSTVHCQSDHSVSYLAAANIDSLP